jgi:signal transduction histidine kinase
VPVELIVEGAPAPLTPGVDLAAYRVIQEALTNVVKHARDARARTRITYRPGSIELSVENDGAAAAEPRADGSGLLGMRERVTLYDGDLEAGPRANGGFAVRARIPIAADA